MDVTDVTAVSPAPSTPCECMSRSVLPAGSARACTSPTVRPVVVHGLQVHRRPLRCVLSSPASSRASVRRRSTPFRMPSSPQCHERNAPHTTPRTPRHDAQRGPLRSVRRMLADKLLSNGWRGQRSDKAGNKPQAGSSTRMQPSNVGALPQRRGLPAGVSNCVDRRDTPSIRCQSAHEAPR